MENPVLESTRSLVENPKFVKINDFHLDYCAEQFAKEELKIPYWKAPVYPKENNESTIDFFLLLNSINFAFTDFKTGQKFTSEYLGKQCSGAYGKTACLKKALDKGIPILEGSFLENISEKEMRDILKGNIEIPMFQERLDIFREVGRVLNQKYDGHFHNLVKASKGKLFNKGMGLIERLTLEFPSFDDSVVHKVLDSEGSYVFDKRAQLAAGMLYGRFRNQGDFQVDDIDKLTVFADYQVPRVLRHLGVLVYDQSLADKVDNKQLIPAGSLDELEIRASTIHAADRLINKINAYRNSEKNKVNALHVDYKLWSEGRNIKEGKPHHLTKTIAY